MAERGTQGARDNAGDDAGAAAGLKGPALGFESVLPLLFGLVGFVLAYRVLLIGNAGFAPDLSALDCGELAQGAPRVFTETPQYRLWVLLICGQTALWFALLAPLLMSLFGSSESRRRVFERSVMLKVLCLGLFLAVAFFSNGFKTPFDFLDSLHAKHDGKMTFFNVVGGTAAILAIIGIWVTQAELRGTGDKSAGEPEGRIGRFLALRSALELYLLAAGVIIGAATLATGALRQAVTAVCPGAAQRFMVQDVLGYGLAFTFLLGLVYAPAHARLASARSALRGELVKLPKPKDLSWDDWNNEHKAVGELLHANAGLFGSLAGAVSILTPLLGSLVSLLLGKGE